MHFKRMNEHKVYMLVAIQFEMRLFVQQQKFEIVRKKSCFFASGTAMSIICPIPCTSVSIFNPSTQEF